MTCDGFGTVYTAKGFRRRCGGCEKCIAQLMGSHNDEGDANASNGCDGLGNYYEDGEVTSCAGCPKCNPECTPHFPGLTVAQIHGHWVRRLKVLHAQLLRIHNDEGYANASTREVQSLKERIGHVEGRIWAIKQVVADYRSEVRE